MLNILCWCVIPKFHHSKLKDTLYKSNEVCKLNKIFSSYSHKLMASLFSNKALKYLFEHFSFNVAQEDLECSSDTEKGKELACAMNDFSLNFETL